MAAINIQPRRETTTTVAGVGAVTHTYTVPNGKRWLIDYIEVEFTVANAGNTCDIQFDQNGAAAPVNIWDQIANVLNNTVDLATKYPRAIEAEETDQFELVFARGAATAVTTTLYIIERDL